MRFFEKMESPTTLILEITLSEKIRRTNYLADKNFRRTKFSAPCKIFGTFVRRIYFKKVFAKHLNLPNFRFCNGFLVNRKYAGLKNSADKIFGGQNFSADKNFGTSSNFWHFCPPNLFQKSLCKTS